MKKLWTKLVRFHIWLGYQEAVNELVAEGHNEKSLMPFEEYYNNELQRRKKKKTNRKRCFAEFKSRKVGNENLHKIYLSYSVLFCLSNNPRWFCRIYRDDWVDCIHRGLGHDDYCGESYGITKLDAYRKAFKIYQQNLSK